MLVSTKEGTLDKKVVAEWCKKYHYARRVPSISFAYGWVNDETRELEAVLAIGKPASNALCEGVCGKEYKQFVYELQRICAKDTLSIPLSSFVGKVLNSCPNFILVSYADTAMGHYGTIYQATNWIYTGATRARTDIATGKHSRHYEKNPDGNYPDRVARSSKHRYIFFTGEKRFKKALRKLLKYPAFPYPKGEGQRYDINWDE